MNNNTKQLLLNISEAIDEELKTLLESQPRSCRSKTALARQCLLLGMEQLKAAK